MYVCVYMYVYIYTYNHTESIVVLKTLNTIFSATYFSDYSRT